MRTQEMTDAQVLADPAAWPNAGRLFVSRRVDGGALQLGIFTGSMLKTADPGVLVHPRAAGYREVPTTAVELTADGWKPDH